MIKFIITLFLVVGMVGFAGVLSGIGGIFLTMFIGGTFVSFVLFLSMRCFFSGKGVLSDIYFVQCRYTDVMCNIAPLNKGFRQEPRTYHAHALAPTLPQYST